MSTRKIVDDLRQQIDDTINDLHRVFDALGPDIEKADLPAGSNKSNKRISVVVAEASSKLKALSKLAFQVRQDVVKHGQVKKEARAQGVKNPPAAVKVEECKCECEPKEEPRAQKMAYPPPPPPPK